MRFLQVNMGQAELQLMPDLLTGLIRHKSVLACLLLVILYLREFPGIMVI